MCSERLQFLIKQEMENLNQNHTPVNEENGCRICLETQPKSDLISPCQCKGSTQFVHQKCLLEWATKNQKIIQTDTTQGYQLQCEICKHKIKLSCLITNRIRTWQQIKQTIIQQEIKFAIEIFGILVLIFCWGFIIKKYLDYKQEGIDLFMYITLSILILLSCVILAIILSFMYDYLVHVSYQYMVCKGEIKKGKTGGDQESAFQMASIHPQVIRKI